MAIHFRLFHRARAAPARRPPWYARRPLLGRRLPLLRSLTVALAAACAALGPACTGDRADGYFGTTERTGKDPATLYLNNGGEPEYLDPGKASDAASQALIRQLFEGLTVYDPRDAHPVQGVAMSFDQSGDNRVFRFHLRPDARWSDGKPVTAGDFEYAWKRVLRPSTGAQEAGNLHVLKNGELFAQGKLLAAKVALTLRAAARPDAPEVARLPAGTFVRLLGEKGAAGQKGLVEVARYDDLPTYAQGAPPSAAPAPARGFADLGDLVEDAAAVGVRAADDRTLDVELERPTPYFLDLTSYPTLAPVRRDVVEPFERRGEPDLWVRPESIVVNGPYTLDEWRFRDEITMKPNPAYWDRDRLRIKRIVWLEIEEHHAMMNLYKTGDLDYSGDTSSLPAEYMPLLRGTKDFVTSPYLSTYWYELNTKAPPLDDVRVRRALNLAIDKRELVEKVTRGGQMPATHYVPDFTGLGYAAQVAADKAAGTDPFSDPEVELSPARARALLKEAGYEVVRDGDGYRAEGFPPLEILHNTGEGHRLIAVAIQDMWKRNLGITASLRNEEFKVMLKDVRDRRFQVVRGGWIADYNHPHTFLDNFLGTSRENHTGWSSPAFDDLIHRAAATADPGASIRLYREAEALAVSGMSRLPLYFYTKSGLVKPWLKGFYGNPRNVHMVRFLWIDPTFESDGGNEPACAPLELPPPGRLDSPAAAPAGTAPAGP
jgi:oligopeptide transport system substrate-binding protein